MKLCAFLVFLSVLPCGALTPAEDITLPQRLTSREGTVEFRMALPRAYASGLKAEVSRIPLIEFPGLAQVEWRSAPAGAELWWRGKNEKPFHHILQGFPLWPGPEEYFIQYTWKADEGLLQLFINGTPVRLPEARFRTLWDDEDRATKVRLPAAPITISDLRVASEQTPAPVLRERVPENLVGRRADLFWDFPPPATVLDADSLKKELLMTNPLSQPQDVANWIMEGPGDTSFRDGWMTLRSRKADAQTPDHGHFVFWCPTQLPASFVAEWDVQILDHAGLLITFFAATGRSGSDLFAPDLEKRDGTFRQYTHGDVNAYHISYYSNPEHEPGRTTSNMRKNPPSMMVAQGPAGSLPGSREIHRVQLIKKGSHIQMSVDGKVIIDWQDDDAERFGKPYGPGHLGFRQMQWTAARYRNLRVWACD